MPNKDVVKPLCSFIIFYSENETMVTYKKTLDQEHNLVCQKLSPLDMFLYPSMPCCKTIMWYGNVVCSIMVMMIGYKEELVYNTWDFLNKYGY